MTDEIKKIHIINTAGDRSAIWMAQSLHGYNLGMHEDPMASLMMKVSILNTANLSIEKEREILDSLRIHSRNCLSVNILSGHLERDPDEGILYLVNALTLQESGAESIKQALGPKNCMYYYSPDTIGAAPENAFNAARLHRQNFDSSLADRIFEKAGQCAGPAAPLPDHVLKGIIHSMDRASGFRSSVDACRMRACSCALRELLAYREKDRLMGR